MEQNGLALELLSDYKKTNKRQFIIILTILVMWFGTIGYLVYILNDIGTIETSSQEITDVKSINNSNIANGDIDGNDKAIKNNN